MDKIILIASCGTPVELYADCDGVATGFGRVVNGYSEGVEHFDKWSDGYTVVSAVEGEAGALPIADAYLELRAIYAREREENEREWAEYNAQVAAEEEEEAARIRDIEEYQAAMDAVFKAPPVPLTHNPFAVLASR